MKNILIYLQQYLTRFLYIKPLRRFFYILIISLLALISYLRYDSDRRTFLFYSPVEGKYLVEERMVHREPSMEKALEAYVEELLLGPMSVLAIPLFPVGTTLESLLVRNDRVYVNLSRHAVYQVSETSTVKGNLRILRDGIHRNFRKIKEIHVYIDGNEPFAVNIQNMTFDKNEKI